MEVFYINGANQSTSYSNCSFTSDYDNNLSVRNVMTCIIIGIGLPLTLVAIYSVYSLVRSDHVAPVYVINLLISDLIQFCCLIAKVARHEDELIFDAVFFIYNFGVISSIFFMVCIALERYVVVTCPLWYHLRRTIKIPVMVSIAVWLLSPVLMITFLLSIDFMIIKTLFAIFLLLPLPLFIFSLVGTLRALSLSCLASDEKRRIVAMLVLVLLIYTLLFLPIIIVYLAETRSGSTFSKLSSICLRLSPLADLFLYIFMRKGIIDKLLASVCCCIMDSNDTSNSTA